MGSLPKLIISGLLFLWNASAAVLMAQSATPELVIQRADAGPCEHAAFSHDGQLLATDNGDEVLVWEVHSNKLVNTMRAYLSPLKDTNGTLWGTARPKGTVVFSPDDKMVAVLPVDFANPLNFGPKPAGSPPSLWNVNTGLPLTTGPWNGDGKGIARNADAPSTPEVESWTIASNRARVAELLANGMKLQALSYDGRFGATRNPEPLNDQHIQLIDLKTGQVLRTLDASFEYVLGMAFSFDGRYFAAHSGNRRFVTIWDTASGAEVTEIKQDVRYPSVGHIAFSPDGKWFAVQQGAEIVLFETASWKRTGAFLPPSRDIIRELTFSPDSKELAVTGDSESLIDVPTGKLMGRMCSSPLQEARAVQWDEKSGVFALASNDFARIWTPVPGAAPTTLTADGTIRAIALSHDGRIALGTRDEGHYSKGNAAYYQGTAKLWQLQASKKEIELENSTQLPAISGSASISLDFTPDGKSVAAAMLDQLPCPAKNRKPECDSDDVPLVGLLTVWDTTTGELLRKRRQPDPELDVVRFSPDALHIASGQQDHIVKIYDIAGLNRSLAFKDPEDETKHPKVSDFGVSALAYSPDGKSLLAGSQDGVVWLLDTAGLNPPRILRAREDFDPQKPNERFSGTIAAVLFSPDGGRAYAVESNGTVWKWNATNWTNIGHYQIQKGASSSALSPNSKVIAVANQDGAIRFYAAESGELELTLASTADANSGLVVSPDGRYDFGTASDSSLASYRVGPKAVAVDSLPGNRRVSGLLGEFLKENSHSKQENFSSTHSQQ